MTILFLIKSILSTPPLRMPLLYTIKSKRKVAFEYIKVVQNRVKDRLACDCDCLTYSGLIVKMTTIIAFFSILCIF